MSTFKKLLALTLALAMVLSVSAFAGYSKDTYKDAANIDADCEEAIELMYALDIMTGDANGNFNPTATITRAEIVKMIYVILNSGNDDKAVNYKGANVFTDVPAGAWYEGYVTYAYMHKLVQGRGNGTFGPNDPVTTAEAAKMLLTAIGYSAEGRGYTGANWAFNVLSDARILGLLEDYNYSTTGYAPRQWVAVMVENALDCYTFDTMKPTFSGLLISGEAEEAYKTMGEKYYGFEVIEGYLTATDAASLEWFAGYDSNGDKDYNEKDDVAPGYVYAADDHVIIDGVQIEDTGLGYMDLGQEFRVIAVDGEAISVVNTGKSVVADAIVNDIEVDVVYKTSSNDAKNKYEFTIDEMVAKFDSYTLNWLTVTATGNSSAAKDADDLENLAGDDCTNLIRAIDKNGDGDIDYIIELQYAYAQITDVDNSKYYGDFFTAKDVNGETYKCDNQTRWYLDDVVNSEDELEEGNVIKVLYNPDNGKYDIEVMPVAEGVTFERGTNAGVYTIDGEKYVIGTCGWAELAEDILTNRDNTGKAMNIVADGEILIMVKKVDDDYSDLADINNQLVMVMDITNDYDVDGWNDEWGVKYMTIDGETHTAEYAVSKIDATKPYIVDITVGGADLTFKTQNLESWNNRLYQIKTSGDKVYLVDLAKVSDLHDALNASTSLFDGFAQKVGVVDTVENEFKATNEKTAYVENENSFFMSYKDSDGWHFKVATLEDLGEGDINGLVEGLYEDIRTTKNYIAGHIYGALALDASNGYLYVTDTGDWDATYTYVDVMFEDSEEPVEILLDEDHATVYENTLYSYTYEKVKGTPVYTLTPVITGENQDHVDFQLVVNANDTITYEDIATGAAYSKYEISDYHKSEQYLQFTYTDGDYAWFDIEDYTIALKTVTAELKQNQAAGQTDDYKYYVEETICFTDWEGLTSAKIINDERVDTTDATYEYYSDFVKDDVTDMIHVVVYQIQVEAND